ncbi:ABC transporter permease subunit [bacterium]|nr:ABC transporter permease subunit [bacterium]
MQFSSLTAKRWQVFLRNKIAVVSLSILAVSLVCSLLSEWIANDRPYILRFQGKTYFPILFQPSAQELGVTDSFSVEYKKLPLQAGDWAVYPPVAFNPFQSNEKLTQFPGPPSSENILGTDDRGRDVFARLLYGFRISFGYALGTWLMTYLIGAVLGLSMGYFGGSVDFIGQRLVEVLNSVPQFFLLIILISIFEPSLVLLILITSTFGWIPISYYIRAEGLRLRKLEFVEAARALGLPKWKIILKHVLPNALTPIVTFSPFAIAAGITGLAALDYLGFGLAPPTPSWGELLNQAKKHFTNAWWLAFFPSAAIFFTLSCLSFVGEGLRNAFDPKQ